MIIDLSSYPVKSVFNHLDYLCGSSKIPNNPDELFDSLKNEMINKDIENAVTDHAIEYPAHGQLRASNELRKRGIFVSPIGVRSIWFKKLSRQYETKIDGFRN